MQSVEVKLALVNNKRVRYRNLSIPGIINCNSFANNISFKEDKINRFLAREGLDELDLSEEDIEEKIKQLTHPKFGFRHSGKYEFEFFKKMIRSLKEYIENESSLKSQYTWGILDPSALSLQTLSIYAEKPECLKEFLENYKSVTV